MISIIIHFFVWFLVWVGLSWPVTMQEIITGMIVSAFVSCMTIGIFNDKKPGKGSAVAATLIKLPLKLFWFVVYVIVFVWECLRANFDVAYRVIHPDLPIRPGTIRIKTALTSDAGLTFLANSITLTPGTTTVDIDRAKGLIYVHQLFIRGDSEAQRRIPSIERFERILKRVFD